MEKTNMQNRIELLEDNFNFSKLDINSKWIVLICSKLDKESYQKKYYKKHKKELSEYRKEYFKTENGKTARQKGDINRRMREKEIINTLTFKEWIEILKKYKFKCAYCNKEFNLFDRPERDHIIPISKGGDNMKENIVPACRSCNAKKHDKLDWII